MTIVFVSNYYNHHQSSFSENMCKLTDGHYFFIATEPMEEERKNMGWKMESIPTFVKLQYQTEKIRLECQQLINDADIVILGCASSSLIHERLIKGKLTFRYAERPFKKDVSWYRMILYRLRSIRNKMRYKNYYMLCASAYTSSDFQKIYSFQDKCFKWGYFPKVKFYDNIRLIIDKKEKASILWVARLIELKHPEIPILVAKHLKEEGYNFTLSMIGIGPMYDEILGLIHLYHLENEICLLGSMTPDEVRAHMEKKQIFLFTSDKNEGWGAVLNEAMNSGCAVIASHAIGSTPFLIKDGKTGFIYKDGDLDDITSKVKWLLTHDEERITIAQNAYKTISETWSAENASKRLLKLAESLTNGEECPFKEGPCSHAEILFDNWK